MKKKTFIWLGTQYERHPIVYTIVALTSAVSIFVVSILGGIFLLKGQYLLGILLLILGLFSIWVYINMYNAAFNFEEELDLMED